MNKLYMMTPLQDTFSCNFNVLVRQATAVGVPAAAWVVNSELSA